jgi:hypothetical protein
MRRLADTGPWETSPHRPKGEAVPEQDALTERPNSLPISKRNTDPPESLHIGCWR